MMSRTKDTKPKSDPIQFKIIEFLKPGIGTENAMRKGTVPLGPSTVPDIKRHVLLKHQSNE